MAAHECQGCREYLELSRRQFFGFAGGALAALSAPAWLPRIALAQDDCSERDVLVSIFLRGASDGLSMCVPHAEDAYYAARPNLAVARPDSSNPNRAIDLNGFFGLAPALAPLLPAYDNGDLLIVHACGSTDPSRSHFDAQRFMEVGKANDPTLLTGWLGRHLLSSAPFTPDAILRAIGISYGLPRALVGPSEAIPIPNLDNFGLSGSVTSLPARREVIEDFYLLWPDPLRAAAETTLATIDLLNQIDFANYTPAGGAVYPASAFGEALRATAALLRAEIGVEAVAIDKGGWDTHNNQGVVSGSMATLMSDLAAGLAAFHADLWHDGAPNVTVVVMSEFGRRLDENGSGGTDHGHGNAMFVLGGHVRGGRVLTHWPGLAPEQLFEQRDLDVTIDYRDVLAEIVRFRLGNANLPYVFPEFTPTFRNVVEPCRSKTDQHIVDEGF